MKAIKTILVAVFAIVTGAVMASGSGNLKVNMEAGDSDLTLGEISGASIRNFELEVNDAYGESIYSMKTTVPAGSLKTKYNFSELEDGTYWFSVKVDNQTTTNKFEVDNGNVVVLESRKSINPYFVFENDLLKFTYMNPQLEDVTLLVYNKSNQVVAEAELGNGLAIHKTVDFANKPAGRYGVVISNEIDVYEYTVSID